MLFWLLTVEPSNPGSTSETDPSPADCSPPVPQNTGREAGTSSSWTRSHAPEPEPTRTARRTPKPSGDARRTALFRNVVVLWQSVRTKCDSPKRTEPRSSFLLPLLHPRARGRVPRRRRDQTQAAPLRRSHSCGESCAELLAAAVGGNLWRAGFPQRMSTQQRYAGAGPRGSMGNGVSKKKKKRTSSREELQTAPN